VWLVGKWFGNKAIASCIAAFLVSYPQLVGDFEALLNMCSPEFWSCAKATWWVHTKLQHWSGTVELTATLKLTVQHWQSVSTMDDVSWCAQSSMTVTLTASYLMSLRLYWLVEFSVWIVGELGVQPQVFARPRPNSLSNSISPFSFSPVTTFTTHHHHHHKCLVPGLQRTRSAWQYKSQYNINKKLTAGIKNVKKVSLQMTLESSSTCYCTSVLLSGFQTIYIVSALHT